MAEFDNYEGRSNQVFELLKKVLGRYVLKVYLQKYRDYKTAAQLLKEIGDPRGHVSAKALEVEEILLDEMDVRGWLFILNDGANTVFRNEINRSARGYINVLIGLRDNHAHQRGSDAIELADVAARVLDRIGEKDHAETVRQWRDEWSGGQYKRSIATPNLLSNRWISPTLLLAIVGGVVVVLVVSVVFSGIIRNDGAGGQLIIETLTPDPTREAQRRQQQLATDIAPLGLTTKQQQDVEEIITTKGYITLEDLRGVGLTEEQLDDLEEHGYLKADDIIATIDMRSTQAATEATGTAEASFCELTPLASSGAVIRSYPLRVVGEGENQIAVLPDGAKARAAGHNGGRPNVDKWWAVQYIDGLGSVVNGWIHSAAVIEIDELACARVLPAAGY